MKLELYTRFYLSNYSRRLFNVNISHSNKSKLVQQVLPDTEFWDRVLTMAILSYKTGFLSESLGQWYTHSSAQPHLTEHHKKRAMKMDPYTTANS